MQQAHDTNMLQSDAGLLQDPEKKKAIDAAREDARLLKIATELADEEERKRQWRVARGEVCALQTERSCWSWMASILFALSVSSRADTASGLPGTGNAFATGCTQRVWLCACELLPQNQHVVLSLCKLSNLLQLMSHVTHTIV